MNRYLTSDTEQSTRVKDELRDDELDQVTGGASMKTPQPGGPLPIPYPNVAKISP